MPLETNFNTAPHWDDYNEEKDFYRILFRPGQAVQTRELNQLQTILQKQIEKFGDNIFKSGTIVDGCHISLLNNIPYVKIKDNQTNGNTVNVDQYKNFYVKNAANLQAFIVTTIEGFEAQTPNLNTLYLKYINSGDSANLTSFSANQVLTIYDPAAPITRIDVANGSANFSNADLVIFTSAIEVQNSTGGYAFSNGFFAGDYISNGLGANVQIVSVANNPSNNSLVIRYKPQASQLVSGNVAAWTLSVTDSIINANTGEVATIRNSIGTGAKAKLETNSVGQIVKFDILQGGVGYTTLPFVTVQPKNANTTNINNLNLNPDTYLAKVTVANTLQNSVGTGYAVTVNKGTIYQKGFFQRVEDQILVVSKYSNTPHEVVVGFQTEESIIDYNLDESLLDNAQGEPNYTAPGADRLQLKPSLVTLSKVEAESKNDFLNILEFTDGNPYRQSLQTEYNVIEKELAKRTFEENGNFVVDQFLLSTTSPADFAKEANSFNMVVDPGTAYINGFRVSTSANYTQEIEKGKKENTVTSQIKLNFGKYIRVRNYAGFLPFSRGDLISLSGTPANYNNAVGSNPVSPGNIIGTCRIRSVVAEDETLGIYNLYLYDIQMNSGRNFSNVRSLFFDGPVAGIADVITDSNGNAVLLDAKNSRMLFKTGLNAVKSIANVSYIYRYEDLTATANSSGIISKALSAGEVFPYVGELNAAEKREIIVAPQANVRAAANISGSISMESGNTTITGTGTSFVVQLRAGDYIRVANSTANAFAKVQAVNNNTIATLTSGASTTISGNAALYFPGGVPIDLQRSGRSANVSGDGTQLTINLGNTINTSVLTILSHNIKTVNAAASSKSVKRSQFVRISTSNNVASNTGPWCVGYPEVIRLRKVYSGPNATFSVAQGTDVTNEFYIDHNQNEDYYGLGYLYKKPGSKLAVSTSSHFLIEFDALTSTSGFASINGYPVNDTLPLANSVTTMNTLEIPEVFGTNEEYFDLRDCVDFRPISNAAVAFSNTAAGAPINPVEPVASEKFNNTAKNFPAPDSVLSASFTYYEGRKDIVVVDEEGRIRAVKGNNATDFPKTPANSILIDELAIPPYPSLPFVLSNQLVQFVDTKVANEKYSNVRQNLYKIKSQAIPGDRKYRQPRVYTQADIGSLARRIEALEYYTSLTFEELQVKNRSIPSVVDPTVERFKFGFFVDSFDDERFSDVYNPEFSCEFNKGKLTPKFSRFNVGLKPFDAESQTGDTLTLPFNEFTISSQLQATVEPVIVVPVTPVTPPSDNTTPVPLPEPLPTPTPTPNTAPVANTEPTPVPNTGIQTVRQIITSIVISNRNRLVNKNGAVFEIDEFYMSQSSGPVEMYFNFRDNDNAIEVFQGFEPNFSISGLSPIITAQSATALSSVDKATKATGLGKLESFSPEGFLGSPPKYAVEDAGKLLWNHNPDNGRYYKIVITKYRKSGNADNWKGVFYYRLYYPIDEAVIDVSPAPIRDTNYFGNMFLTPDYFDIQSIDGLQATPSVLSYSAKGQVFQIAVTGLKPNTIHNFKFQAYDANAKVRPSGKNLGDSLISDNTGKLNFEFFYDTSIDDSTSTVTQENELAAYFANSKLVQVHNDDYSSVAEAYIAPKSYTEVPINTPNTYITVGGGSGGRLADGGIFGGNVDFV